MTDDIERFTSPDQPEGPGVKAGRPAPGTGCVWIHKTRDGWDGHWTDDDGHILPSRTPLTFPDVLEWARGLPAPEIHIMNDWNREGLYQVPRVDPREGD